MVEQIPETRIVDHQAPVPSESLEMSTCVTDHQIPPVNNESGGSTQNNYDYIDRLAGSMEDDNGEIKVGNDQLEGDDGESDDQSQARSRSSSQGMIYATNPDRR